MSARPCLDCGTTEGVQSYSLCQPCGFARGVAERAAQGLGPHCTHGPTLRRVITIAGLAPASAASGRSVDRPPSAPPAGAADGVAVDHRNGADDHLTGSSGKAPRRTSQSTTLAPATARKNGRSGGEAVSLTAPAPTTAAL